jgi:hypothetical protein
MTDPFAMEDEDDFFWDPEENPAGSGFQIPEDDYAVHCTDVVKGYSKSSGNPMWTFDFSVTEGPHAGFDFKVFCALTPAALWKLDEVMIALGFKDKDSKEKVKFSKKDAIGRSAMAKVVDDEYNGTERSSISKLSVHPKGYAYASTLDSPPF